MIALLISSSYLIFISLVTGHEISKRLRLNSSLAEKALLGIAISNSVFSFVSLFLPVRPYISLIYFIICLGFFFADFRSYKFFSFSGIKPRNLFFLTFPVVLIFGFINSLYPPLVYDSGLYHIQAIEWIENYRAIPGLVNLHGRFGFNPNIFVLFAATSFDGIFKHEVYSVNFVIYFFISIWLLRSVYSFIENKQYSFGFIFSISLIMMINSSSILSSPTPDFACYYFPFFILLRFIQIKISDKANDVTSYFSIIFLAFYVITIKLAAVPVLLIIPLVLYQNRKNISKGNVITVICISAFILIPWLLRNIILTGWLVYPFAGIDLFSFDWKVPKAEVLKMSQTITAWARTPNHAGPFMESVHMSISQWFPIWWSAKTLPNRIVFLSICFMPLLIFILIWFQKMKEIMKGYQPVYFIAFLGFVFWFIVAPDWRYGLPFLVLPLLLPLLFVNYSIKGKNKFTISLVALLLISYTVFQNLPALTYVDTNFSKLEFVTPRIIRTNNFGPVNFKKYMMDEKLEVKFPVDDYRCFDEEIPCASYYEPLTHLRGDNIQSGFCYKPVNK